MGSLPAHASNTAGQAPLIHPGGSNGAEDRRPPWHPQ